MNSATWTYSKSNVFTGYQFTEKDLDHRIRIYKKYNIVPESLERVRVDFLLQKEYLIRFIIKELDILLETDGFFEINLINSKNHCSYFRSRDQVKYEFSISTNGRYVLIETRQNGEYLKLIYQKKTATLPSSDTIDKWSFGIITNGKKIDSLNNLINTIINQNIPNFEIIICGPYPTNQKIDYSKIRILNDVLNENDLRFPIPTKKNKIITIAKFENLCILHDRFSLPINWFKQMKNYGNFFDFLCLPTLDNNHNRFAVDWMSFVFPLTSRLRRNKPLNYEYWSTDLIIQGGVIIGKTCQINKYKLDERLHWEEMEDIHFSKMAYLDGALFRLDENNFFYSESINHKSAKLPNGITNFLETILWYLSIMKSYIKFNIMVRYYNKQKN